VTGLSALPLTGMVNVLVNTTGEAVQQTIATGVSSSISLNFTDGTNGTVDERMFAEIEGTLSATIANFGSLTGDFGFATQSDGNGGIYILAGVQNVTAVVGTSS